MARIPLQVATRSLDTAPLVQYPQGGGPVGAAMENAGDALQGVAMRVKRQQDQQADFDARVKEMEFSSQVSGLEMEAEQNAAADGSGIHDNVYGQIDPETNTAVKPGSFDQLFDSYLERMPESKRGEFAAKREAYRSEGSVRMAGKQYKARQQYETVQIQKAETAITNAMAAADPNDAETFERFKQQGIDLIEKSGLPALEKDVAKVNWQANADETLFKTKLAKDPDFAAKARNALGLASEGAPVDVANIGSGHDGAKALLRKKEGFRSSPYWDVNAHRIGYGSDTITRADGSVVRVQPGMTVSRADAERDLDRRVQEFENVAIRQVGRREWGALPAAAKAALTSVTYNYGDLPGSVVNAIKSGNIESVAASVEALQGHNNGVNADRRRAEAAMIRGHGDMQGIGPVTGPDPEFAGIPLDRRLILANQADVQVGEQQRAASAQMAADYAAYKDATELSIVSGQLVDEQLVMNDGILNDGDKATLIRSLRSQNESSIQLSSDLAALSGKSLVLDPYDSKDKTRADNLYTETMKRAGPEQAVAVAGAILDQTGIVPQPVMNTMRRGLSGTNVQEFVTAAQTAQRVATQYPAALSRRDGGAEVQKTADDFSFMVNTMNLAPEEAARRLIEKNDPTKQFQRKALEPAAKEFVKEVSDEDFAGQFNETWFSSDPAVGVTPAQEFGIKAEYLAIAEDQFYASNGDPELAKNRAIEEMKRLYGVTEFGGGKTIVKHPPERYWPKAETQPGLTLMGVETGLGADPFQYAKTQLYQDVSAIDPEHEPGSIQLVTTPQTDREVKAGELPGYSVLWKDKDGVIQTIPGRLWKPDVKAMQQAEVARRQQIQDAATERAHQADIDLLAGRDRNYGLDQLLGDPLAPKPYTPSRKAEPGSNIPADLPAPATDVDLPLGNPMGN